MANSKKGSSTETEQNVNIAEISETLTPQEVVKPELTLEQLTQNLLDAKKALNVANEAANFEETPETLKCEANVNAARKALNDFNKVAERKKLESQFNEKLTLAKDDLVNKLNISHEFLNTLLENSKDVKDSLKSSFNIVFGAMPKFLAQGENSHSLNKEKVPRETSTATSEGNVNAIVQDLFDKGLTHEEILNMGHSEGRIRNVAYKVDYAKDKLTSKYAPRVR